ncbi:ribosome small subunit-dependent GTPase A [Thermoanaerobacter sp. CM-CNRG TB177]|uniref:Small ribosomal subunit biogenesis GTPase RsgA n=2 Tax=Thermoanaerobacter TaxID=1754 RepID=D3T2W5_THEIA|nr:MULTISPECIES: ribosome small subunit-dependent GTPase A [Thermoanaerobacter]ADD02567.1 ribosome small subunit-dependent GTPase A [Thermoanaerobacter italicus Ab9]MBT1279675.1 ribosome small subunit-dependent GTPase A [Thermoanaerobacter sp. CM-CNRG TB177]MDP9750022.1 ribosome biogenesis GTPase [Thermoanaerobacter pentosaceus]
MTRVVGKIVGGIAGFYYVATEHGIIECRARGKFRKDNVTLLVGDIAEIQMINDREGYILNILPRKNKLTRPPVANVDQAIIVFAIIRPELNRILLDKMIVLAESNDIEPVVCINKVDLKEDKEAFDLVSVYQKIGYKAVATSTVTKEGIDELKSYLKDKVSFFAGPSGVGKSSLINSIQSNIKLKTGEVSEKLLRGKHTTRSVELLSLDFGGYVLDTPGFTALTLDIEKQDLRYYFREFLEFQGGCKFSSCLHIQEPGCNVIKAVEEGLIDKNRYVSYISLFKELKEKEKRRY